MERNRLLLVHPNGIHPFAIAQHTPPPPSCSWPIYHPGIFRPHGLGPPKERVHDT